MGKHAVLSASGSHRWLNCSPSARLNWSLRTPFGSGKRGNCRTRSVRTQAEEGSEKREETSCIEYDSDEMEECTDGYVQFVMEQYEAAKQICTDPIILIEQHLDFSCYVPDGFGTGDCIIVSDDTFISSTLNTESVFWWMQLTIPR